MMLQTARKQNLSNFIAVLQHHFRVAESNFWRLHDVATFRNNFYAKYLFLNDEKVWKDLFIDHIVVNKLVFDFQIDRKSKPQIIRRREGNFDWLLQGAIIFFISLTCFFIGCILLFQIMQHEHVWNLYRAISSQWKHLESHVAAS